MVLPFRVDLLDDILCCQVECLSDRIVADDLGTANVTAGLDIIVGNIAFRKTFTTRIGQDNWSLLGIRQRTTAETVREVCTAGNYDNSLFGTVEAYSVSSPHMLRIFNHFDNFLFRMVRTQKTWDSGCYGRHNS